jgi:ceramide glucosyltransferase
MLAASSSVAAYLALIWAAVLVWLAIGAALRRYQLHARFESDARASAAGRRVLIVRPCAGAEPGLRDNLLSIAAAKTTAELQLIMTVDQPDDGARPIAEEVAAHLRGLGFDARVEVRPPIGPNRKASMLAEVLREHGRAHELVVNVDSNVDLGGFDLDALLAPVLARSSKIGVAWAPWAEHRSSAGVGPRASEAVLGGSLTAFPLLCGIHPNGLVGKIWAARIDALAAAGEFAELARYLGEDLAMADRLRAAGWQVAVVPVLGRVRGGQPSLTEVIERIGRWMLVVRGQQPGLLPAYPLFFFATPMVCALASLGLLSSPELAATAIALAVAARLLVTLSARYWSGRGVRPIAIVVDAVLSDLVLMLAWIRAVSRREVEWRGHRLRVEPGGRLSSLE